jgi:hypothetical protein
MQLRSYAWASFAVACLFWPSLVAADTRVVVHDFRGSSSAKQLRNAVVGVLQEHGVEIIPPKKAKATAKSSGAELDTESGRVRVAKKLKLRAFVDGRVSMVKRKMQVKVTVYGGSDGMPAAEWKQNVTKATLVRDVKANLWSVIGPAIGDSGVAPEPIAELEPVAEAPRRPARVEEPAPPPSKPTARRPVAVAPTQERDRETPPGVRPSEEPQAPSENDEALSMAEQADQEEYKGPRPSPFDLGVGARIGTRDFGYHDSLPGGLRAYDGLAPAVALRAHWYPAAHVTTGVLANIGLDLRGELTFGVPITNKQGQKFSASSHAFGVGVRARVPLDKLELAAVAGFGQHSFGLSGDDARVDPDVPDVLYNFVRTGLELNWQFLDPFAVQLRAAYLFGLSQGEIAERAWFPHAKGNGVEAEIGATYAVSQVFALELAFTLQRYFMSLNPEVNDPGVRIDSNPRVAGGALDKYFSSRVGVIIRP